MGHENKNNEDLVKVICRLVNFIVALTVTIVFLLVILFCNLDLEPKKSVIKTKAFVSDQAENIIPDVWTASDSSDMKSEKNFEEILYGRNLISNTSYYLGPQGKIAHMSNGMNCQNCHLEAGTKPFGNNYSAVASTYPKFRERSGSKESISKRVNDCFERSLNGKGLDSSSREMKSIISYIKWLGKDVSKGEKPKGSGLTDLAFLNRAANPEAGKIVYQTKCKSCHGENGEGKINTNTNNLSYQYPPLWGDDSYNIGAGLFRLSRFAGYVKSNMPQGVTYLTPQLTDEESWDVAAFVNSQPRPSKDLNQDWPKITEKPVDHPFGPYADKFSEQQHKYGPFELIAAAKTKTNKQKNK